MKTVIHQLFFFKSLISCSTWYVVLNMVKYFHFYQDTRATFVILQTGAVIELRRPQGWRTREYISCHQSVGTWVWLSKMSQTSLVQAEWPVEFKRDFNIIKRELSRATLLFSLVFIEPSGTFDMIHQIAIYEIKSRDFGQFKAGF